MPILQEKVIELVETALRAHRRLEEIRVMSINGRENLTHELTNELQKESPDANRIAQLTKQFIDALYYRLDEMQIGNMEDRLLLVREQERYNYRFKHNEYARNRLRRQREDKAAASSNGISAPNTMHATSHSIQPGSPAALKEIQRRAREAGVIFDAEGNIVDEPPAEPYLLPSQRPRPAPEPQHPAPESHIDPRPAPESQHPIPTPDDDEEIHAQRIRANDARAFETGEDLPP